MYCYCCIFIIFCALLFYVLIDHCLTVIETWINSMGTSATGMTPTNRFHTYVFVDFLLLFRFSSSSFSLFSFFQILIFAGVSLGRHPRLLGAAATAQVERQAGGVFREQLRPGRRQGANRLRPRAHEVHTGI